LAFAVSNGKHLPREPHSRCANWGNTGYRHTALPPNLPRFRRDTTPCLLNVLPQLFSTGGVSNIFQTDSNALTIFCSGHIYGGSALYQSAILLTPPLGGNHHIPLRNCPPLSWGTRTLYPQGETNPFPHTRFTRETLAVLHTHVRPDLTNPQSGRPTSIPSYHPNTDESLPTTTSGYTNHRRSTPTRTTCRGAFLSNQPGPRFYKPPFSLVRQRSHPFLLAPPAQTRCPVVPSPRGVLTSQSGRFSKRHPQRKHSPAVRPRGHHTRLARPSTPLVSPPRLSLPPSMCGSHPPHSISQASHKPPRGSLTSPRATHPLFGAPHWRARSTPSGLSPLADRSPRFLHTPWGVAPPNSRRRLSLTTNTFAFTPLSTGVQKAHLSFPAHPLRPPPISWPHQTKPLLWPFTTLSPPLFSPKNFFCWATLHHPPSFLSNTSHTALGAPHTPTEW